LKIEGTTTFPGKGGFMTETKVLLVDDERENIRYLTTILEENGFKHIYSAANGEEGMKQVEAVNPGLIVLDIRMPRKSGIIMFNELKRFGSTRTSRSSS
jgi:two-component system alkaline phosphatase synthesis response regulator PhoP